MARDPESDVDERVKRSVARTLGNGVAVLILLGLLGAWASLGAFTLQPGQAAVLLRLGRHAGTISEAGFHLTLPPPIVLREIIDVGQVRSEDFGTASGRPEDVQESLHEAAMQTSDNNIVLVLFSVQYRIKDPFTARYRVADPVAVVRDAAQAAMREAVGSMTVDGVLRERKEALTSDVASLLQDILDSYDAGIDVEEVQLQDVQPPAAVRAAFDDVVAATQDASRVMNEAEGYRNEVLPDARGRASELQAQAEGHRAAVVADATGEASRFQAVATEYRKAPAVTEKRLYLETLEAVLPNVETVIIEPGSAGVLPYLPIGRDAAPRPAAPQPAEAKPAEAKQ